MPWIFFLCVCNLSYGILVLLLHVFFCTPKLGDTEGNFSVVLWWLITGKCIFGLAIRECAHSL